MIKLKPIVEEILTEARKRNYKKEYRRYHSLPEQKKRRAQRNHARRKMIEAGKVRKGSMSDVHHRNRNTADNSSRNLVIVHRSVNRGDNK